MTDRFTVHDYDAAWQVWDNVERRSCANGLTEKAALAEAARLNASRPAWAKDVVAWAIKDWRGRLHAPTVHYTRAEAIASYTSQKGWRTAKRAGNTCVRVRITEIPEQEASDGE